ncbi:uncharacterized protein C8Q71DRAFT_703444 [Rhodofomes roseus]|uniref:Rhodanese domain-containing protein n=1 Tax=Rhodofomes roseus TaxID=34475 RepID=A0ABQ8KNZ6_9APHY|nr:uncharacterized protein C8Q71DRAFT_703444 [Rhodofomes roseus]KAH9840152.1 hypothetical protein C8Q71DRAFT_703444 [Rhodofomes roseus]
MSASGHRTASIASVDPASPPSRTLHGVRQRTADSMAVRAVQQAEDVDGAKIGVVFTLSRSADEQFLGLVASAIRRVSFRQRFLFAIGCPSASPAERSPLVFCGTTDELVQRAGVLSSAKFLGRVTEGSSAVSQLWICSVRNLAATAYDELALWDCLRKAARVPADPLAPPPGARSVQQLLSHARARLERLTPQQAYEDLLSTNRPYAIILVDIRPARQRMQDGGIHGAIVVERGLLEWHLDPQSPQRLAVANRYDTRIVIFDHEGDASSFAAVSLHDLGLLRATDLIGGYAAWREAGLPMEVTPTAPAESVRPSEEY